MRRTPNSLASSTRNSLLPQEIFCLTTIGRATFVSFKTLFSVPPFGSTGTTIDKRDIEEAILRIPAANEAILNRPLGNGFDVGSVIREVERHYLERAMEEGQGVKARAAELLGLGSYQTVTDWLKRHGIA